MAIVETVGIIGDARVDVGVVRYDAPTRKRFAAYIYLNTATSLFAAIDREERIVRVGRGNIAFLDLEKRHRSQQFSVQPLSFRPELKLARLFRIERVTV